MNENQRNEFLKDEYLMLQGFYEDFDRRALTIKGWSVTVALAGIALGFEKKAPEIWALAGIAAVMFWVIDTKWRMYQYANRKRINEIEEYFRGEKELLPLQMSSRWWSGYKEQSMRKVAFYRIVMLPHAPTAVLSIGLLVVHYFVRSLV